MSPDLPEMREFRARPGPRSDCVAVFAERTSSTQGIDCPVVDDVVPKWELFIGYQWLNPGGNVPDQSTPPSALPSSCPRSSQGLRHQSGLQLHQESGSRRQLRRGLEPQRAVSTPFSVGPKYTWRGDDVNFFVHTLLGFERLAADGIPSSNGVAALLGGGMDIKLWKPVTLRLFEADFQWARQNFSCVVPPNDSQAAPSELQRCPPDDRSGVQLRRSS